MAISKTVISDISDLRDFLEDSGYFDSVTLEGSVVTCKDADENVLALFEMRKVTAYTNATTSASRSYQNQSLFIKEAYKCANGIIITLAANGYTTEYILITKSNNGSIVFVFATNALSANTSKSVYCITWGDESAEYFTHSYSTANQTIMMPFGTKNAYGTSSYTPYAYSIIYGQYYNMGIGSISSDGTEFLTNGYWAILDE